jgi:hypothetical protein
MMSRAACIIVPRKCPVNSHRTDLELQRALILRLNIECPGLKSEGEAENVARVDVVGWQWYAVGML